MLLPTDFLDLLKDSIFNLRLLHDSLAYVVMQRDNSRVGFLLLKGLDFPL